MDEITLIPYIQNIYKWVYKDEPLDQDLKIIVIRACREQKVDDLVIVRQLLDLYDVPTLQDENQIMKYLERMARSKYDIKLKRVNNPGDGNCFFYTYGPIDPNLAFWRNLSCEYVRRHFNELKGKKVINKNYTTAEQYCKYINQDRNWGEDIDANFIFQMSGVLNLIYLDDDDTWHPNAFIYNATNEEIWERYISNVTNIVFSSYVKGGGHFNRFKIVINGQELDFISNNNPLGLIKRIYRLLPVLKIV